MPEEKKKKTPEILKRMNDLAAKLVGELTKFKEPERGYLSTLILLLRGATYDLEQEPATLEQMLVAYSTLTLKTFKINMYYNLLREKLEAQYTNELQYIREQLLRRLDAINRMIKKRVRASVTE